MVSTLWHCSQPICLFNTYSCSIHPSINSCFLSVGLSFFLASFFCTCNCAAILKFLHWVLGVSWEHEERLLILFNFPGVQCIRRTQKRMAACLRAYVDQLTFVCLYICLWVFFLKLNGWRDEFCQAVSVLCVLDIALREFVCKHKVFRFLSHIRQKDEEISGDLSVVTEPASTCLSATCVFSYSLCPIGLRWLICQAVCWPPLPSLCHQSPIPVVQGWLICQAMSPDIFFSFLQGPMWVSESVEQTSWRDLVTFHTTDDKCYVFSVFSFLFISPLSPFLLSWSWSLSFSL